MKTFTFIILAGSHSANGCSYPKGTQITSDKRLDSVFPGRFKLVEDTKDSAPAEEESIAKAPTATESDPDIDFGKNVTKAKFPEAVKKDLFVFLSNEGEYTITTQTEPSVKINKGSFKKKLSVDTFITKYEEVS